MIEGVWAAVVGTAVCDVEGGRAMLLDDLHLWKHVVRKKHVVDKAERKCRSRAQTVGKM